MASPYMPQRTRKPIAKPELPGGYMPVLPPSGPWAGAPGMDVVSPRQEEASQEMLNRLWETVKDASLQALPPAPGEPGLAKPQQAMEAKAKYGLKAPPTAAGDLKSGQTPNELVRRAMKQFGFSAPPGFEFMDSPEEQAKKSLEQETKRREAVTNEVSMKRDLLNRLEDADRRAKKEFYQRSAADSFRGMLDLVTHRPLRPSDQASLMEIQEKARQGVYEDYGMEQVLAGQDPKSSFSRSVHKMAEELTGAPKGAFDEIPGAIVQPLLQTMARATQQQQLYAAEKLAEMSKERVDRLVKAGDAFRRDPLYGDFEEAMAAAQNIEAMISSDSQIAPRAVAIMLAKASGEKGVLTDRDVRKFEKAGNKIQEWINDGSWLVRGRPSQKYVDEVQKFSIELQDALRRRMLERANPAIDRFLDAYGNIYGYDRPQVIEQFVGMENWAALQDKVTVRLKKDIGDYKKGTKFELSKEEAEEAIRAGQAERL